MQKSTGFTSYTYINKRSEVLHRNVQQKDRKTENFSSPEENQNALTVGAAISRPIGYSSVFSERRIAAPTVEMANRARSAHITDA